MTTPGRALLPIAGNRRLVGCTWCEVLRLTFLPLTPEPVAFYDRAIAHTARLACQPQSCAPWSAVRREVEPSDLPQSLLWGFHGPLDFHRTCAASPQPPTRYQCRGVIMRRHSVLKHRGAQQGSLWDLQVCRGLERYAFSPALSRKALPTMQRTWNSLPRYLMVTV